MEQNEILILHGTDYAAMANQLLRAADVAARIGDRHRLVALKPNLVVDAPASGGAPRIRSLWPAQLNICMKTDSKTFA